MEMIYKSVTDNTVLDVDDSSRRVKVVISEMGSKDFDNDIIAEGAYNKTIKERGPEGKNKIYHFTDHRADTKNVLGKFHELYVNNNQLIGVNNIVKTAHGNDALELYKSGIITEHSVGFTVVKQTIEKGSPRILNEIKLFEGSAVMFGANENTPTLSVGKSLEEKQSAYAKIIKEIEALQNILKNGNITDEAGELLEIRLISLQTSFKNLFDSFTTSAVDNTQKPEESAGFNWTNVLLNIQN